MKNVDAAGSVWSQTFAKRLLELQPQLDLAAAIRACVEVLPEGGELDPEQAAQVFDVCSPPARRQNGARR